MLNGMSSSGLQVNEFMSMSRFSLMKVDVLSLRLAHFGHVRVGCVSIGIGGDRVVFLPPPYNRPLDSIIN